MAKAITGLDLITAPLRANYRFAIESTTDPLEETQGFNLATMSGDNVRVINSAADWADVTSGGIITLAANTAYLIRGNVEVDDRFVVSAGAILAGESVGSGSVTYTGSGAMFTSTNVSFSMRRITISAASASKVFDMTSAVSGKFLSIRSCVITATPKLGTLDGVGLLVDFSAFAGFANGFDFAGNLPIVSVNTGQFIDTDVGSIALDLGTSVCPSISIGGFTFFRGTGTGISGAALGANVTSGVIAIVENTDFSNITTPISGIARTDVRWSFRNCNGVDDSLRIAEIDLTTTETVIISSSATFVMIGGTSWSEEIAESFTTTTSGEITYVGETGRRVKVTIVASIEKVGGGADQLEMRIGVDTGSGYTTPARTRGVTENTTPTTVTSQGTFAITEGDVFAPFVSNNDSTANIDVVVSSFIIEQVAIN